MEGIDCRQAQQRRRNVAEESGRRAVAGLGHLSRRKDLRHQDGQRQRERHGRARDSRHRLAGDRAAVHAIRRQHYLVDRGARAEGIAAQTGDNRRRLHRARAGHRLPQARLRSGIHRGTGPHPATLRCRTPAADFDVAAQAQGAGASRCEGDGGEDARQDDDGRVHRRRREAAEGKGRPRARDRRPPPLHRGLGAGEYGGRPGRAVRQGRQPVPHVDAQRLGHRRPCRRADAGTQGVGAGRDGRRNHRRPPPRIRPGRHPGGLLHRTRNRRRRPDTDRGGESRYCHNHRQVPLRCQRTRAGDAGWRRRRLCAHHRPAR